MDLMDKPENRLIEFRCDFHLEKKANLMGG